MNQLTKNYMLMFIINIFNLIIERGHMILPIITSNINTTYTKNISFSGKYCTNSMDYKNFNETVKDEFVKNIEEEKKSVITWANDRIEKLNSILDAIAKNDEMPKSEKPKVAATAWDNELIRKAEELKNNSKISPSDRYDLEKAIEYARTHKNPETDNLPGTAVNDLNAAIDNAQKSSNISTKGHIDSDLDEYVPDETTDIPADADTDSCDGCDSGCGDECDCLSDTADCIS